jgi:protein required for attachment to host cells
MPPKALGEFRAGMSARLKPHVIGEWPKDLTQYTVPDIERHLKHPQAVD